MFSKGCNAIPELIYGITAKRSVLRIRGQYCVLKNVYISE